MSTGAAAVAAARRAERRLVESLRDAGAVNADSASTIPQQRWMGKRVLARLIAAGAVREAGPGHYLDEATYQTFVARRRRKTLIGLGAATVISVVIIVWASMR